MYSHKKYINTLRVSTPEDDSGMGRVGSEDDLDL